jgi:hypothetical protein
MRVVGALLTSSVEGHHSLSYWYSHAPGKVARERSVASDEENPALRA